MPRPHKPDKRQQDLWENTGRKLGYLRTVCFFRTPAQKLMWVMLELMIGDWRTKRIPMEDLAEQVQIGTKAGYKVAAELRDEFGLIKYEPASKNSGQAPLFEIRWAQVVILHEEWLNSRGRNVPNHLTEDVLCATTSSPLEATSCPPEANSLPLPATSSLLQENPCRPEATPSRLQANHIMNSPSSAFELSLEPPSTSSSDEDAAIEAVMVRVMNCGVGQFGRAVEIAIAQGMTIDQIHAVVDHFTAEGNSGRWSPNVLYERLTRIGMHLAAADQGWFGENPEWKAQREREAREAVRQQLIEATQRTAKPSTVAVADTTADALEASYGAALDAMTPADRRALMADQSPFIVGAIARAGVDAHKSKLWRSRFLEALKARDSQ